MCETLIDAYANNVIAVAIEEQKNEEDEKREFISDYIDASMELLFLLRDMVETWEAKNGEMNTRQSRKEYAEFMGNLIDNLDKNSFIGNSIITNLNNMTFFAQKLFSKYEYLRISEVTNEDIKALADAFAEGNYNSEDICQKVNKNVAIELPTYDLATDTLGTKFSTVSEYFLEFVHNMFDNSEMGRTRQLYSFQTLNSVAEDFPDPSNYTGFGLMYFYMKTYVAMFYTIFDDVKDELDDSSFLEDVFNLCNKYPVEYNDEYDELLVRYLDMEDIPHIELEYVQHGHFSEKSIGYANLGFLCGM